MFLTLALTGCGSDSDEFGTSGDGVQEMNWTAELRAHNSRPDVPAVCIDISRVYRCQFLVRIKNSRSTPQEISGNFYLETGNWRR